MIHLLHSKCGYKTSLYIMADTDQGVWTVDTEVSLFYAMRGHKPVGMYVLDTF